MRPFGESSLHSNELSHGTAPKADFTVDVFKEHISCENYQGSTGYRADLYSTKTLGTIFQCGPCYHAGKNRRDGGVCLHEGAT